MKSCSGLTHADLSFCLPPADPEQQCPAPAQPGGHDETTKRTAERAAGHGREEPVNGDGGDEARGHPSNPAH